MNRQRDEGMGMSGMHHVPKHSGTYHPKKTSTSTHPYQLGWDFITDFTSSDGNICVLVTVSWFSKACKLVPLKGLPTAMETAKLLFSHVFCNCGI